MRLVIDVGNTQTVYGLWSGTEWIAVWRKSTDRDATEDEIAAWLKQMFDLASLEFRVDGVIMASVVPTIDNALAKLCERWLNVPARFLRAGVDVGLPVEYSPPTAVGADRLANALGALARFQPPIIVVDAGTATTFDVVDSRGVYVGGAIMTGVEVSTNALTLRTAKLPQVDLVAPDRAIGRNVVESLQSGIMLGYAGAIDALVARIDYELGGGSTVLATGGLGGAFVGLCKRLERYEPTLTLDGLLIADSRLSA